MPTQLFFDLTARSGRIHFCEQEKLAKTAPELSAHNVALLPIDGASINSEVDMYRVFAVAFQMPTGWYGDEEYAPNANAFLEYLDDVEEWIPSQHRVAVVRRAEHFWREQPRIAGTLVELWQFATLDREAKTHLLFVW